MSELPAQFVPTVFDWPIFAVTMPPPTRPGWNAVINAFPVELWRLGNGFRYLRRQIGKLSTEFGARQMAIFESPAHRDLPGAPGDQQRLQPLCLECSLPERVWGLAG